MRVRGTSIAGMTFGRLQALQYRGNSRWLCACSCGTQTIAVVTDLEKGHTRSCGCLVRELLTARNTKHRSSGTREYGIWKGMRARCRDPGNSVFAYYGGRGIRVCARWNEFENFLADMGRCPTGHEIERNNSNGNYEPDNCRWATRSEQMRNTRANRLLNLDGTTLCAAEWAARLGLSQQALHNRLRRGWPLKRALVATTAKAPSR